MEKRKMDKRAKTFSFSNFIIIVMLGLLLFTNLKPSFMADEADGAQEAMAMMEDRVRELEEAMTEVQKETTEEAPEEEAVQTEQAEESEAEETAVEPDVIQETETNTEAVEVETAEEIVSAFEAGTFSGNYTYAGTGGFLDYWVIVPEGNTENMPMVVYLHGDSYIYSYDSLPNSRLAVSIRAEYGNSAPCIILIPHFHKEVDWVGSAEAEKTMGLIQKVAEDYKVDTGKIAITGVGRGAIGCWQIVSQYRDMFCAAAPISCRPSYINAANFVNTPVKAFCGDSNDDYGYYGADIQAAVDNINNAGGTATFTVLEDCNHNQSEGIAYSKELVDWLISK